MFLWLIFMPLVFFFVTFNSKFSQTILLPILLLYVYIYTNTKTKLIKPLYWKHNLFIIRISGHFPTSVLPTHRRLRWVLPGPKLLFWGQFGREQPQGVFPILLLQFACRKAKTASTQTGCGGHIEGIPVPARLLLLFQVRAQGKWLK